MAIACSRQLGTEGLRVEEAGRANGKGVGGDRRYWVRGYLVRDALPGHGRGTRKQAWLGRLRIDRARRYIEGRA